MKSKVFKIFKTVILLQFIFGVSIVSAFDDDFLKLQQEHFRLQRQLQEQQYKLRQQFMDQQFKEQQQQFELNQQLMNQQFQMQRQLTKLETNIRNLNLNSSLSSLAIGSSPFNSMNNMRSQIRMQDYNINSITNTLNSDLLKLQNQQFRIQQQLLRQTFKDQQQLSKMMNTSSNYMTKSFLQGNKPFGTRFQSFNMNSSLPTLEQMRQYDSYWSTGQYWTQDPYYADFARPAPDLTPENYIKAFGYTSGILYFNWTKFMVTSIPGLDPWLSFGYKQFSILARSYMMNELVKLDPGGDLTYNLYHGVQKPLDFWGGLIGSVRDVHGLIRGTHIYPYKSTTIDQVMSNPKTFIAIIPETGFGLGVDKSAAGIVFRRMLDDPMSKYQTSRFMEKIGETLSNSFQDNSTSMTTTTTISDYNRYFDTSNFNWDYSYGSNSLISQPTFNNSFGGYSNFQIYQTTYLNTNFGSYGNNSHIYQPQTNYDFGGYNSYSGIDFKSINNSYPKIDDLFLGFQKDN